jgi:hypothetical protein
MKVPFCELHTGQLACVSASLLTVPHFAHAK